MQLILSSKQIELTEGFRTFVERKLSKFKKFSSLGLSSLFITVDVDTKRKGASQDAVVEIVGNTAHRRVVVKEQGETFYKAFFGAVRKLRIALLKQKDKRISHFVHIR